MQSNLGNVLIRHLKSFKHISNPKRLILQHLPEENENFFSYVAAEHILSLFPCLCIGLMYRLIYLLLWVLTFCARDLIQKRKKKRKMPLKAFVQSKRVAESQFCGNSLKFIVRTSTWNFHLIMTNMFSFLEFRNRQFISTQHNFFSGLKQFFHTQSAE